jgi:hypothetical protein
MTLTGGSRLAARERGREGWACSIKRGRATQLGHVGRDKKKKAGWAGRCGRNNKKEEEEKEMGQAKREREGEKMHSNAFEFDFKI